MSTRRHPARIPAKPATCVCQILDAPNSSEVVFDDVPARVIADLGDRALVTNVAHVIMTLDATMTNAREWHIETDPEEPNLYVVMVKFPAGSIFTSRQLSLVELVNELRVKQVWVQPEEDCVYIGTTVWNSTADITLTVQDIVVIRHMVDEDPTDRPGTRKRQRVPGKNGP